MNWNEIQANWHLYRGKVKEKWGELTNDEIAQVDGEFEQLVALIEKKRNVDREIAEFQVREFQQTVGAPTVRSRETFVTHMEEKLKSSREKLTQLRQKAEAATGNAKKQLDAEVAELSKRYDEAKNRLGKVKGASGEAWKELAAGCKESWIRFKTACDSAWRRISA